VNAFVQELFRAGIYKRTQGRIARQLTWLAMALVVGLGLWRLSDTLEGWDPGWRRDISAQRAGAVKLTPNGEIVIVDSQANELEKHVIPEEGAQQKVKQDQQVIAGTVLYIYNPLSNPWMRAAFCLGLPGVLLIAGLWVAYRTVNVPASADFLITVEAEMNKVSWPSRSELFRASMVVLFTIFFLATILFSFDAFWKWFFQFLDIFPGKKNGNGAVAGFGLDWRVLLTLISKVS
jgi:preprotein translocase SecE subunit